MKVLFKYNGKTETIENVSVDDKCLPLIEGKHPYSTVSQDTSPLAHQSALWFKSLAVDSIYIDCDRRLIFWSPLVNDTDPNGVILRKSLSSNPSTKNAFVPDGARPLFEDSNLYDFDANLKEMIVKCCDAARKYFKKAITIDEFSRLVAKLLHVYILPSITFSSDDMYSLSRARCLIEERLGKAEDNIEQKAHSIEQLKKCQTTLKTNLLNRENLNSERYLRTCSKDFLEVFLKTIEADVEELNFQLAAEQSKVDWAKKHAEDAERLKSVQRKRDDLYKAIDGLINVREAIKNVCKRKDLTKKKTKKPKIIQSCFHNVFVEINRRLDIEYQALNRLGNDKVSICAAREATMCAILELDNNNRHSDRATKFEPEDFVDYTLSESNEDAKRDVWLTFQERVSKVLDDSSSVAYALHKNGCASLSAYINFALSDFRLAKSGDTLRRKESGSRSFSKSQTDISHHRKMTIISDKSDLENIHVEDMDTVHVSCTPKSTINPSKLNTLGPPQSSSLQPDQDFKRDRRALSTSDIALSVDDQWVYFEPESINSQNDVQLRRSLAQLSDVEMRNDNNTSVSEEGNNSVLLRLSARNRRSQQQVMTLQLALSALMNCVEHLKGLIQTHFREVTDGLSQQLDGGEPDDSPVIEQQELLWKVYERTFCKDLLPDLLQLYSTSLTPGAQKAHATLARTPLEEILKDDKLLDLFFGPDTVSVKQSQGIQIPSGARSSESSSEPSNTISMAKTLSCLTVDMRHCDIDDLYDLANADSSDLRKRFNLDEVDETEGGINFKASSSSSESGDLSFDEAGQNHRRRSSAANAHHDSSDRNTRISFIDHDSSFEEQDRRESIVSQNGTERSRSLSNPVKIEEILDPVLSPFRKQVRKCLDAECFLDKVRYITKAIEGLNRAISQMLGPDFQSACDDIISMIILALSNMSEDVFVELYVNLRLLMDVLPSFLSGTLWDYNLVSLCASYDYLFTLKVCESVVKRFPGSFKVRGGR